MAGTEETQAIEIANADAGAGNTDPSDDWRTGRGPVDDSIRAITVSELHGRVHTARTWRAQGMVVGEPLELVRDACRQFLSDTSDASLQLVCTPYVPKKKPCADCRGIDMHRPTCIQLRR